MKIIIAGAGEVGFHLAKLLSYEAQDITLIDTDKNSLVYAENHLDIKVIRGDATSISVLAEANIENKTIVLTGAMIPYAFGTSSDGFFNLGSALAFVQTLSNGRCSHQLCTRRNR